MDHQSKVSIIFLNGPSSSGKSSLAKLLQDKLDKPYMHIGIDKLIEMMPEKLNKWDGQKAEQGFYWDISVDEKGNQLAHIQLGEFAQKVSNLLKEVVLTMIKSGFNLIIDEVCVTDGSFEKWQEILSDYKTIYVGLKSDTKTLQERENKREDRMKGSSRAQNLMVHKDKTYDIEINTDQLSLDESVNEIIQFYHG